MKLALGTVQFGLDYGINNLRGRIPQDEVDTILDVALNNDIKFIDTAYAYGKSEIVLGNYFHEHECRFNIISKYPPDCSVSVKEMIQKSLSRLNIDFLYGYLLHSYKTFKDNYRIFAELQTLKKSGLVKKIGFSLYYPNEVKELLELDVDFDIVQVPYSILDQRFESVFDVLKKRRVEIHVRSVFLQGLLFKKVTELSGLFLKIKDKIAFLNECVYEYKLSISAICLGFAILNQAIDCIVIGVDNKENLLNNINSYSELDKIRKIYPDLLQLAIEDEQILLPFLWK